MARSRESLRQAEVSALQRAYQEIAVGLEIGIKDRNVVIVRQQIQTLHTREASDGRHYNLHSPVLLDQGGSGISCPLWQASQSLPMDNPQPGA